MTAFNTAMFFLGYAIGMTIFFMAAMLYRGRR